MGGVGWNVFQPRGWFNGEKGLKDGSLHWTIPSVLRIVIRLQLGGNVNEGSANEQCPGPKSALSREAIVGNVSACWRMLGIVFVWCLY